MGADSLFAIETWKHFREIFPTCTILAAMRDDKDAADMEKQIQYLESAYGAKKSRILRAPPAGDFLDYAPEAGFPGEEHLLYGDRRGSRVYQKKSLVSKSFYLTVNSKHQKGDWDHGRLGENSQETKIKLKKKRISAYTRGHVYGRVSCNAV